MNTNSKDIKPFYIYTDKNCLYIKNINEHTEKLSNNIYTYSANIDDNNTIHICCIDVNGKLIHFFNKDNHWKKRNVYKIFNNIKNIKNIRLYIINNFLNIFVVESTPLSENIYRVSHFNFNPSNYKISKYHINNILKEKEFFYRLNIDELSNIILEYKSISNQNRGCNNNTLIFNSSSRTWLSSNTLLRGGFNQEHVSSYSNIRDDIFEYCYSIIYKI